MAWITLNEGEGDELSLRIVQDGATRRVVQIGGSYSRAFDGSLRATIATEKVEYDLTTVPMDEADANAVEVMFANGAQFTLSGDIVGAATLTFMGTAVESQLVIHNLVHRRQLKLLLQEV